MHLKYAHPGVALSYITNYNTTKILIRGEHITIQVVESWSESSQTNMELT